MALVLLRPRGAAHARRAGFSLVEAVLVMAIMTVATAMYAQIVGSSARLAPIAAETTLACDAARDALERIRAVPVEDLIATFDADKTNDPDGPGTAPGRTFAVAGLIAQPGTPVGTIVLPMVDGRIAEDVVDEMLGCPRDLNADRLIDAHDHREDWVLLPIRVRVEWLPRGAKRTRSFELYTMVARV